VQRTGQAERRSSKQARWLAQSDARATEAHEGALATVLLSLRSPSRVRAGEAKWLGHPIRSCTQFASTLILCHSVASCHWDQFGEVKQGLCQRHGMFIALVIVPLQNLQAQARPFQQNRKSAGE
jgi:hypothetical protein